MANVIDDGGEFLRQASIARSMGSNFVAEILEAGLRQLYHAPRTAEMVKTWPGNRGNDAVALRFNGALHALARRGVSTALAALYRTLGGDFDAVIAATLASEDDFIAEWMKGAPQTNEVGRAAAIYAALAVAAQRFQMPFELLELGSSAGLNLNLAYYGYDLGGVRGGAEASSVQLKPEWRGPPPPGTAVKIASARGVDIDPLDISEASSRERLLAYVWADDLDRARRLEAAIAIAECHPPQIDRANAAAWIVSALSAPQRAGSCRTIAHSIVLQYLSADDRAKVEVAIEAAGQRATAERPLAWVQYEWDSDRSKVALQLITWPGRHAVELATCHAHAAWIDWKGQPSDRSRNYR